MAESIPSSMTFDEKKNQRRSASALFPTHFSE